MVYKKITGFVMAAISGITFTNGVFAQESAETIAANGYLQSIHVINLLQNNDLNDPGMTPTPIFVHYYNGGGQPCWTNRLNYQEDVVAHAGPYLGCKEKITRVVIEPGLVADKLNTYGPAINVAIDTTKFATQVMVMQAQAPLFNSHSGLVDQPGTIQVKTQAQLVG